MLVKEIELDQPKRLKISEDNRVRDAKGPRVGVAICLFQRRKWNRGGSGAGIHWSPRHPVLPAAPRPLGHSGSIWRTDTWFLFLDSWLSGVIRKEGLEISYVLKFRLSLYYNAGCSFTFLCVKFFTGTLNDFENELVCILSPKLARKYLGGEADPNFSPTYSLLV